MITDPLTILNFRCWRLHLAIDNGRAVKNESLE